MNKRAFGFFWACLIGFPLIVFPSVPDFEKLKGNVREKIEMRYDIDLIQKKQNVNLSAIEITSYSREGKKTEYHHYSPDGSLLSRWLFYSTPDKLTTVKESYNVLGIVYKTVTNIEILKPVKKVEERDYPRFDKIPYSKKDIVSDENNQVIGHEELYTDGSSDRKFVSVFDKYGNIVEWRSLLANFTKYRRVLLDYDKVGNIVKLREYLYITNGVYVPDGVLTAYSEFKYSYWDINEEDQ